MDAPLDSARLFTFLAVAREGGFSRAARRLGRTQSSVSQAVALLESELGQPLFVREGRAIALTEAGKLLAEDAARILADMDAARSRLQAAAGLRAGELVIGTSDTLACYLLPPVFAAFRERYPGIELRLENRPSPAIAAAVAERRVQLGVVSLPLPPSTESGGRPLSARLTLEPLVAQEDVAICSPRHPLAGRRRVTLRALAEASLLLLDRTTASRAHLELALARLPRRPRIAMETASVEVLKRLAELDFGVAVVPALAVARETKAGALVALRIAGLDDGPGPSRGVALATAAVGPPAPAAAAFAALARAVLCGPAYK